MLLVEYKLQRLKQTCTSAKPNQRISLVAYVELLGSDQNVLNTFNAADAILKMSRKFEKNVKILGFGDYYLELL